MSAALAVPMPSHNPSHSPSGAASAQTTSGAQYQPPAPPRAAEPSQRPQAFSSPIRAPPTSMDSSSRGEPAVEQRTQEHSADTAQRHSGTSAPSQSSDSRPLPPSSNIEIKTERAHSPPPPPPPSTQTQAATVPRRRPQRLDLNATSNPIPPGRPSAPLTAKDSATFSAMQDVAITCLSPGFDTSDPNRRHQMERSRDLAEQQRQIIASRQNKGGPKDLSAAKVPLDLGPPPSSFSKPLGTSRRKAPPTSLSIGPGSQVSEPRVIQSAPLGQTFSGFNRSAHPLSRQVLDHTHHHNHQQTVAYATHQPNQQPSAHSPGYRTPQSATRLPPIQDVFANENLGASRPSSSLQRNHSDTQRAGGSTAQSLYAPITNIPMTHSPLHANSAVSDPMSTTRSHPTLPPVRTSNNPIPGHGDSHSSSGQQSGSSNSQMRNVEREYRSAEEAVHSMVGGREELLPKIIHYGGHQPPTPPSPLPPLGYGSHQQVTSAHHERPTSANLKIEASQGSGSSRRRPREEFERDMEPGDLDEGERERERERERDKARERGGLGFGFGAWTNDSRARHSPETMRRKKEEFISLCARAWDLMHE